MKLVQCRVVKIIAESARTGGVCHAWCTQRKDMTEGSTANVVLTLKDPLFALLPFGQAPAPSGLLKSAVTAYL
jgi:hypothetical protein